MGVYDIYGKKGIQIKAGNDGKSINDYRVGDKVPLRDGIYIGYCGIIVIKDNIFIAEYDYVYDKWGGIIPPAEIINPNNPINKVFNNEKD